MFFQCTCPLMKTTHGRSFYENENKDNNLVYTHRSLMRTYARICLDSLPSPTIRTVRKIRIPTDSSPSVRTYIWMAPDRLCLEILKESTNNELEPSFKNLTEHPLQWMQSISNAAFAHAPVCSKTQLRTTLARIN